MGEKREAVLAALCAGLGLLAAVRVVPAQARTIGLPCATSQVGRDGPLAECGGPGVLGSGERRVLALPIDINAATAEELQALPGIGHKLALRIVADRQAHGAFGRMADLGRIPGIGAGKLRLLVGQAAVGPGWQPPPARYTPPSR